MSLFVKPIKYRFLVEGLTDYLGHLHTVCLLRFEAAELQRQILDVSQALSGPAAGKGRVGTATQLALRLRREPADRQSRAGIDGHDHRPAF